MTDTIKLHCKCTLFQLGCSNTCVLHFLILVLKSISVLSIECIPVEMKAAEGSLFDLFILLVIVQDLCRRVALTFILDNFVKSEEPRTTRKTCESPENVQLSTEFHLYSHWKHGNIYPQSIVLLLLQGFRVGLFYLPDGFCLNKSVAAWQAKHVYFSKVF